MEIKRPPLEDHYLTQHEAAALLGVHPTTLPYRESHGKGPKAVKWGRRLWYREEEVREYLAPEFRDRLKVA